MLFTSFTVVFLLLDVSKSARSELSDLLSTSNQEWRYEYSANITRNNKIFAVITNELELGNHVPFYSKACDGTAINAFYLDQSPQSSSNDVVFMIFVEASNWLQLGLDNPFIYEDFSLIRRSLMAYHKWDKREWIINVQAVLDYFKKRVLRRQYDIKYDLTNISIHHDSRMIAKLSFLVNKISALWKSHALPEFLLHAILKMINQVTDANCLKLQTEHCYNIRYSYAILW